MAAAEQLADAGHRVLVLEARNRIGGRIHSLHPPGWESPIELGAEFVHGQHEGLAALCAAAGIEQVEVPERHWQSDRGRLRPDDGFWERIGRSLRRIGPAFTGSFLDALRVHGSALTAQERRDLREFVTHFHAADPERCSARTLFVAAHEDDPQSRPQGGYGAVVQALSGRLPNDRVALELNAPVTRIRWRGGAVEVESGAAARRWRARLAVVTVPLGVLQAGDDAAGAIRFDPPLEERAAQWRSLGWGHVARVVVRLHPSIWREPILPAALREDDGRAFGFLHTHEPEFPVWWALAPEPVVVGWWGGPEVRIAGGLTENELAERAVRSLAAGLGVRTEHLTRLVEDVRLHNWSRDIYARGAYSFATAGQESAAEALADPVEQTLYFAGEAFASPLDVGTVHGALDSGKRAGRAAAAALLARRGGVGRVRSGAPS